MKNDFFAGIGKIGEPLTIEHLIEVYGEYGALELIKATNPPLSPAGVEKVRRLRGRVEGSSR